MLLVAWGREARRAATRGFDGFSGLHAECLPWLQEREVAVLGSDGISDPMPFVGTPQWPFPVHQIGITAMGLHLIDNMALAALSRPVRGRRPVGVPLHHGPAAHRPGAPGARSTRWPSCERRTTSSGPCCSATPGPSTGATSTPWPRLFHPEATIVGTRGSQTLDEWLDTMRAPRAFPPSMHLLGDPLIALEDGGGPRRPRHLCGGLPARRPGLGRRAT